MYTADFEFSNGKSFEFSYLNGIVFDISPLSGVPVNISTSQGFRQLGNTITGVNASGVIRTVSGYVKSPSVAERMANLFTFYASGKLIVNTESGSYFCRCHVKETPTIVQARNGSIQFMIALYCPMPYWESCTQSIFSVQKSTPAFSFPTKFNTHQFGIANQNMRMNAVNSGDIDVSLNITFSANSSVENYGLQNVNTPEEIAFTDTINQGDIVDVFLSNGELIAQKTTGAGTESIIGKLTDNSNLFFAHPGDNILRGTADAGEGNLKVTVKFYCPKLAVIA